MEQQTVSKEACKSSLKATLSQKFNSAYIKNANHSIENLTDNGELETFDRQLLLTTSTSLENLVNSNLSNLQHCDCKKETEFQSNFVQWNKTHLTSSPDFECNRCGKKVNLKSIPVVKPQLAQDLRYVTSLLFHSLSMGNISKISTKFSGLSAWITSVPLVKWIHIVEWIAPFVKRFAE